MSEKLAKVNFCCCCIELKLGLIVLFVYYSICTVFCLAFFCINIQQWQDGKEPVPQNANDVFKDCTESQTAITLNYLLSCMSEFFGIVIGIGCFVGLVGIMLNIKQLLIVTLIVMLIYLVDDLFLITLSLYGITMSYCARYILNFISNFIVLLVDVSLNSYFVVVINSAVLQMQSRNWTLFLSIWLVVAIGNCANISYRHHTLYHAIPETKKQVIFLSNLEKFYDVHFWTELGQPNFPVEFTISPNDKRLFQIESQEYSLPLTVLLDDIQDELDKQSVTKYYRSGEPASFDWEGYHELEDIHNWLQDLSATHPEEVTISNIGRSAEDRDIKVVKIVRKGSPQRSTVIIEGGIHGREWMSPAVVTYLIDKVANVDINGSDPLAKIAAIYEWYFVPLLNPDGYDYTHKEDRLWMKNRRSFQNSNSSGVDLNRNFGINHMTSNHSNTRRDTFPGSNPFSEGETSAIAKFAQSKNEKLEYYISFHAYGQVMVIPYEYTDAHLDNYDEMLKMLQSAAAVIRVKSDRNTSYQIGLSSETNGYGASGSSTSWVKRALRVPYVVTIELPPARSQKGLALSADQIRPVCEETLEGFISLLTPRKRFAKLGPFAPETNEDCKVVHEAAGLLSYVCPTSWSNPWDVVGDGTTLVANVGVLMFCTIFSIILISKE